MTLGKMIEPKVFQGVLEREASDIDHGENLASFWALCKRQWPDLVKGAEVIVLPTEDFLVLIECLKGTPYLATRSAIAVKGAP